MEALARTKKSSKTLTMDIFAGIFISVKGA